MHVCRVLCASVFVLLPFGGMTQTATALEEPEQRTPAVNDVHLQISKGDSILASVELLEANDFNCESVFEQDVFDCLRTVKNDATNRYWNKKIRLVGRDDIVEETYINNSVVIQD